MLKTFSTHKLIFLPLMPCVKHKKENKAKLDFLFACKQTNIPDYELMEPTCFSFKCPTLHFKHNFSKWIKLLVMGPLN